IEAAGGAIGDAAVTGADESPCLHQLPHFQVALGHNHLHYRCIQLGERCTRRGGDADLPPGTDTAEMHFVTVDDHAAHTAGHDVAGIDHAIRGAQTHTAVAALD